MERPPTSASSRLAAQPLSVQRATRDIPPRVLVLDQDATFRRAVRRILASAVPVVEAPSCDAADRAIRSAAVCAYIVEADVRDGSGLAWLASLRRGGVRLPALVLSSKCDPAIANQAFVLGAHYACKPLPPQALRAFAIDAAFRAEALVGAQPDLLRAFAAKLRSEHGLTAPEAALVEAVLRGAVAREDLVAVSGVPIDTLKSRIRRTLRKVGARSLGEIRDRALQDVAAGAT
jgi:DNA-binding NarL/FixJ family response regulator